MAACLIILGLRGVARCERWTLGGFQPKISIYHHHLLFVANLGVSQKRTLGEVASKLFDVTYFSRSAMWCIHTSATPRTTPFGKFILVIPPAQRAVKFDF